jgi:hypothetical protein
MIPECPVESWCTREPRSTQVTISMSRCGWVSNPAPGVTVSSLFTRSNPWWVLSASYWWPKEKECLESSQLIFVAKRSCARRMSTVGDIVLISGPLAVGATPSGGCVIYQPST